MDEAALNLFAKMQQDYLTVFMMAVTYGGSALTISGLTALTAFYFYLSQAYLRLVQLIVAVGGSAATTFLVKEIFSRERPLDALYVEGTASFPSGHATAAMALYGFLIYTLWRSRRKKGRVFAAGLLAFLIVLIGLSRLYLGVHYLSDVLSGYAIGLIWILISLLISKLKTYSFTP